MSHEQVDKLPVALRNLRDRRLVLLVPNAGLRPGETLGLQLADIGYGRRRVFVRCRDDHPKGARSRSRVERVVDLHDGVTLDSLSVYVLGERPPEAASPFIFLVGGSGKNRTGPLSYSALARPFARACKRVGIRETWMTPHSLRHTHTTRMREAGMRKLTLQRRLGHASPESTRIHTRIPDERTKVHVRHILYHRSVGISTDYLFQESLKVTCAAAGLGDQTGKPTISAHRFRQSVGTQLAERGAKQRTIMSVLGHQSPQLSLFYARISDAEVLRDYKSVLEPGQLIAGPGAEAVRPGKLSCSAIDWLKTNFIKTELAIGHCLRLPSEGPCECDLYLNCAKFATTKTYAGGLRDRRKIELALVNDARDREWPREVERHPGIAARIEKLLADLDEPVEG